jgi:hypothetical protein
MRHLVCSVKYFVALINSSLLTVRTTLVYSDTEYSAPFMSLLPSSIMSHLFIRFAFTVFVSFVPLVITSFLPSFLHSFIYSFFLSFLPWVCLFMPGDWVRLCGIHCSRTGVHVNETISVLGNNNRILGFNTTIRNAPSVAWGSPRTRVVLRFAVELIHNWHLQVCWHTNWIERVTEMLQRQTFNFTQLVQCKGDVQNKCFCNISSASFFITWSRVYWQNCFTRVEKCDFLILPSVT